MSTPYSPNNKKMFVSPGTVKAPDFLKSDLSRVLPRQNSTGSTRGTQNVGVGGTKIDGANNRIQVGDSILIDGSNDVILVTNDDGSQLGMGKIPDSLESGFFSLDVDGNLIMKIVNGTMYVYDGTEDRMQAGILPDGSINVAISKEGESVTDAFS